MSHGLKNPGEDHILCLETAGDAAGMGPAGLEEQEGGPLRDRGGEAGPCPAQEGTWLLPAPALQAPSSPPRFRPLFGEQSFSFFTNL